MDALYFRVSSDRQTTENQFEDLLQAAERDGSGRNWAKIREDLAAAVYPEDRPTHDGGIRTVYKVRPDIAAQLAKQCIYLEQGKSGKAGARRRPLFDQMKLDAGARKFDRLLVWKVSRLGRDMREVIATVYELADLGITVFPLKSQTGAITSTLGKLLWAIQAWYAEMENDERAQAIKAGQVRARAGGKHIGRPRRIFDPKQILEMRDDRGMAWREISMKLKLGIGTVTRAYETAKNPRSKSIPKIP